MTMGLRGRRLAALSIVALAGLLAPASGGDAPIRLTERERALHVLNRLAFGPRPGDVDRVAATGVSAWIERQLHPNRISDAAVDGRLAQIPTLAMSNAALLARYEEPLREARKALKAGRASAADGDPEAGGARLAASIPPENRPRRILEDLTQARVVRAVSSERQLNEVLVDFWMNHFNVFANKGLDRIFIASFERDTIRPRIWGRFEDLLLATAQSPAMLFYLDNARSAAEPENRPAGGFGRARGGAEAKGPTGLNENYARELLELHTLGVDGGYTQSDVTELARVLTGWSIGRPRDDQNAAPARVGRRGAGREPEEPGSFVFRQRLHDLGAKTVLGRRFPAGGGMNEGEDALRLLARHPSTARHLATELCRRLVADDPPAPLVDRVAARYLATGGDLTETVRAVVTSPEFFDPRYFRAKIKSPFEYAVSAVRAAGAESDGRALGRRIADIGEPLYLCQPPTGYSDSSDAWVNSGALLARLNFAMALTSNRIPGTPVEERSLPPSGPGRSIQDEALALLGTDVSAQTVETVSARLAEGGGDRPRATLAGLLLGSPEFQRQ
jgi:uncharacterized protein (DUF1800 family)